MGVTIRTEDWRYTEWMVYDWKKNGTIPLWDKMEGKELYDHRTTDENNFDSFENDNLAYDAQYMGVVEQMHDLLVATWDNQTWQIA